jgi:hypothetical protein
MSPNGTLIFLARAVEFDPKLVKAGACPKRWGYECTTLTAVYRANSIDCEPTMSLQEVCRPGAEFYPTTKQFVTRNPAGRQVGIYVGWSQNSI